MLFVGGLVDWHARVEGDDVGLVWGLAGACDEVEIGPFVAESDAGRVVADEAPVADGSLSTWTRWGSRPDEMKLTASVKTMAEVTDIRKAHATLLDRSTRRIVHRMGETEH